MKVHMLKDELAKALDITHNHTVTLSNDDIRGLIAYSLGVGNYQGRNSVKEAASTTVNWVLDTYK